MSVFTIAALQLNLKASDNLDLVIKKTRATLLRYPFTEMVILSELAIGGGGAKIANPRLAGVEEKLCSLAKELGIWLVPGSLHEDSDGKIYNTAPVISPDGEVVTRYRKMFPFTPYETDVEPGSDLCIFDVPEVGRFGVLICYDKWFPELTRGLAWEGAEVLISPTLTDTIDRDLELSMVRATAAQNQCYFIDVNSTGDQGYGKSIFAGPEGEVVYEASHREEVMVVEVDLNKVRRTRERGLMGLGQPLKSYRDADHKYPQEQAGNTSNMLASLGELDKPGR